jgi:hypothetical protein
VTDFAIGEGGTGIMEIMDEGGKMEDEDVRMKEVIFDLSGRHVDNPKQGLYIKNGRKYLIK